MTDDILIFSRCICLLMSFSWTYTLEAQQLDLPTIKNDEIIWEQGTLRLTDGQKLEGRFILDETYTEGAVLHLVENDTVKIKTWPAFKVESLDYHNRAIIKIYCKLEPLAPMQWILVEKIHEEKHYRLIQRRIPFNDIIVFPFAIGSAAWIVWASKISYRKVFFIIDRQNRVAEISGPTKDQGGDISPRLLFRALKVDKKRLKKLLKQQELNAFESKDLPKILKHTETLLDSSD